MFYSWWLADHLKNNNYKTSWKYDLGLIIATLLATLFILVVMFGLGYISVKILEFIF